MDVFLGGTTKSLDIFAEFYRRGSREYKLVMKLHEYLLEHSSCGQPGLRWLPDDDETIVHWFDGDYETSDHFYPIASTNQSGLFAVWILDGISRKEMPFVFLGAEGDAHVIARSVFDFLSLVILTVDDLEFSFSHLDFISENSPPGKLSKFRDWLSDECGISPAGDPSSLIEEAQQQFPSLQKFVENWADKWFSAKDTK